MESILINALIPVAVWTIIAGLATVWLRYTSVGDALVRYHASSAILMALPLGLIAAVFFSTTALFSFPGSSFVPSTISTGVAELSTVVVWSSDVMRESASSGSGISLFQLIVPVFLLMVFFGLLRLTLIYAQLKRALGNSEEINEPRIQAILDGVLSTLGVNKKTRLLISTEAKIPFTTGLRSPVIVLPSDILRNHSENQIRMILLHEATHISRGDYAVHFFEMIVRHLFWMHPLVHSLYHQSGYWREVSCDESVLAEPDSNLFHYAKMLYDFAAIRHEKRGFKAAMALEKGLLRRIEAISSSSTQSPNQKEKTMKKSIITAIGFMLLTAGIMACTDTMKSSETTIEADQQIEIDGQTLSVSDFRSSVEQSRAEALQISEDSAFLALRDNNETKEALMKSMEYYNDILEMLDRGDVQKALDTFKAYQSEYKNYADAPQQETFKIIERVPEMIGGQAALYENLRYPAEAAEQGAQGRVVLSFIVNRDGKPVNIKVASSAGHDQLDQAAVKALSEMEFVPAIENGEIVEAELFQPVVFRMNE